MTDSRADNPSSTQATKRDSDSPRTCPNCGCSTDTLFCCECGQNNRSPRLTTRAVFAPLIEEITELELPIINTIIGMTIRPGRVCLDFISGKRKRYTNPIKFSFLTGALFVLVLQVFDLHPDEGIQDLLQGTQFHVPENAQDADDPQRAHLTIALRDFVEGWLQFLNLLLIPILALLLMVLYRKNRLNLAEHSVFLLFIFGHSFLISIPLLLMGLYSNWQTWIAMQFWPWIYLWWAACVFYTGHWLMHGVKMFVLLVAKTVASAMLGAAIAIAYVLWTALIS